MSVTTSLSNIAFHSWQIWLQTLVAIDSESCQTLFPSFCALPSEVAVLLDSNLSRRPFLGHVIYLDLLLFTRFDSEHAVCSYVIFLLTDQWLIERLRAAMIAALVCTDFSPIQLNISFHMKNESDWLQPKIYKPSKPFWL